MKEYCFTIERVEDDTITEEILSTWNPSEAIECAEKLEDEGIEFCITKEIYIDECIYGTEEIDLFDLQSEFCD